MDEKLVGGDLYRRHCRHHLPAELRVEPGHGPLEGGVVVEGDLVADVVAPRIDVVGVAGTLRAADERAIEDVAIVARGVDVAVDHAAGPAMVRIERRVVAEADDVAPPLRIVAEHVVDLPDREVVIAAPLVADGVAVDERQE